MKNIVPLFGEESRFLGYVKISDMDRIIDRFNGATFADPDVSLYFSNVLKKFICIAYDFREKEKAHHATVIPNDMALPVILTHMDDDEAMSTVEEYGLSITKMS